MRIVRFVDVRGRARFGAQAPDGQIEMLQGDIASGFRPTGKFSKVKRLLVPFLPPNIYCVGLNFRRHAAEFNLPLPEFPVIFMKPTSALIGPDDPIRLPACSTHGPEVDYEAELAVVIGKPGRDIDEEEALDYVIGYTCANDVSARWWQKNTGGQWIRGKSFDSFCPIGPAIVTADEIGDPQSLILTSTLNGKVMQQGDTSDMIFTVAQLISFISRDTTLLPGTVILTGTPPGVGFARTPAVFLKQGDWITITIDKIGELSNPVKEA